MKQQIMAMLRIVAVTALLACIGCSQQACCRHRPGRCACFREARSSVRSEETSASATADAASSVYVSLLRHILGREREEAPASLLTVEPLVVVWSTSVAGYLTGDVARVLKEADMDTEPYDTVAELNEWSRLESSAIRSFVYANERAHDLEQWLAGDSLPGLAIVDPRSPRADSLRARRPPVRAFLSLSLAGLSDTGRQALVYVDSESGPGSGYEKFYLLERVTAGWVVVEMLLLSDT